MADPLPNNSGEHAEERRDTNTVSDPLPIERSVDEEDERHRRWRLLRRVCHLRETVPERASELLMHTEKYKFKAAAFYSYPNEEMWQKLQQYVENSEEKLQVPNWEGVRKMIAEVKKDEPKESVPLEYNREERQAEFESLMQRVQDLKKSQKEIDTAAEFLIRTPKEIRSVRETQERFIEDLDSVIEKTWGPTEVLFTADNTERMSERNLQGRG